MSSDNSFVVMKLPRNPGIVIAQPDAFIFSFPYLGMIEGTWYGWKPSYFAHESLITEISAPPSMRAEKLPIGEVLEIME